MINAVTTTGAVTPVGAATRPSVQETAVRHAAPAAPAPHVTAPATHESTVVTISAQATHTAEAAHVAQTANAHPTSAQATAKATVDQVKANAQRSAANPTTAPKPATDAAQPTAAPVPAIHGVYFSPVPAPLSLDPIPSQHLPEIAFDPADVNQDGQVSTSEAEAYSFHHEPTLAAQPGETSADLTAYTSIARS
ncbi:MAG TPA: hypothetical protein VGM81_12585 [Burkholderiaceae bacterium]